MSDISNNNNVSYGVLVTYIRFSTFRGPWGYNLPRFLFPVRPIQVTAFRSVTLIYCWTSLRQGVLDLVKYTAYQLPLCYLFGPLTIVHYTCSAHLRRCILYCLPSPCLTHIVWTQLWQTYHPSSSFTNHVLFFVQKWPIFLSIYLSASTFHNRRSLVYSYICLLYTSRCV